MNILKEFREFAIKGNVVDLAVGVIIGSAFGKIVSSLVSDMVMPPIGFLLGGVNFTDLKLVIKQASVSSAGKVTDAVTLNYGNFIQTVFDFAIIAFTIFLIIQIVNRLKRHEEKKKEEIKEVKVTKDQELLTEIRDLLKKQGKKEKK
ncbi:MAG: large-conductance mechanosensitive channel protein MscL [Candidatus Gracilibacteria bacterium]